MRPSAGSLTSSGGRSGTTSAPPRPSRRWRRSCSSFAAARVPETVHLPGNENMVRVVLPAHLRTLANIDREVQVEVSGAVTQQSILDAIEARYPMLRGT